MKLNLYMFEKFTEGAIKVIMLSQEEARRMGHNFVGTEQLFLGIVGQRQGVGAKALRSLGVTLKKARKEVETYIGRGTGFVASEIPFTPRAKRVSEILVIGMPVQPAITSAMSSSITISTCVLFKPAFSLI